MKLIVILFLMTITPIAFSQNEWWRIGKNAETEKQTEEVTKKEKPQQLEKPEEVTPETKEKDNWIKDSIVEPENIKPGKVNIIKSSSVDKIIGFKSATIPPNTSPLKDGYRIQLFFDQDRSAIDKARSTMLEMDDESPTYIEYKAPNYFLLQGDYRTQLEAEKIRAALISNFPEAIVIEDKIYLPEIEEEMIKEE
jgi:hypothetical protein